MPTIRRQTSIRIPPADIDAVWAYYEHWIVTGNARLACDAIMCVDAVQSGHVTFRPGEDGGTEATFELDAPDDTSVPLLEIETRVAHDLDAFKQFAEHRHDKVKRHGSSPPVRDSSLDPGPAAMFWHR